MFNGGQSPASIFSLTHSNRLNHELYSEPSFPAPQLYLLRHTLKANLIPKLKVEIKSRKWSNYFSQLEYVNLLENLYVNGQGRIHNAW